MKKLIILSTRAGGGHTTVSNALNHYLRDMYNIEIVDVFDEVLRPMDVIRKVTLGKYSIVSFYNKVLLATWTTRLLNWIYMYFPWYLFFSTKTMEALLEAYIQEKKPDLIISVIPVINTPILAVAKKHNIPFLLIPTDLNPHVFLHKIKNPSYQKFIIAQSFNAPEIYNFFHKAGIAQDSMRVTGIPLRPEFFTQKDKNSIKKSFNIPSQKPVIMLMLGSQGSGHLVDFAQQLTKLTIPAHIIICVGSNNGLLESIRNLTFPSHITITILSFTDRIADLMAIADIFITKSGTISVCEAIAMRLPMILDATIPILFWERFNHAFIRQYGLGYTVTQTAQLDTLVTRILSNHDERARIRNNMQKFYTQNPTDGIKQIITNFLI